MIVRPIPCSGEMLPVIGCGTYLGFDVAHDSVEFRSLPEVLSALFDAGGSVVDTSPMYGRAEEALGHLLHANRKRAFIASKVWTHGREAGTRQLHESMHLMRTEYIDLMQVHNLLDWHIHLPALREWKARGLIRYVGITHCDASAYPEMEKVMRAEALDFIQINYSLEHHEAAERILPLAADLGIAVLANMPFGSGWQLRRPHDQPLPPWAAEIGIESWPQLLLKFVLSHPSVTCVIPGTGNPRHMQDNLRAGEGDIPELAFWDSHPF
jgi:diketogulonate reductase-like aldo/keto reductase